MGDGSCSEPPWTVARQLVLRDLDSTEMVVLPERRARCGPFWSPDSQSIAFIALNAHVRSSKESSSQEDPHG